MDIQEIRRANLRKLIDARGGPKALGEVLGYSNGSYLLQMCGPNPIRTISDRNARKFEETLELPPGYLDRTNGAAPVIDTGLVRDAIQRTANAIEQAGVTLSPTKIGDLATAVYEDAIAHGGVVRSEYIDMLVRLLK